MNEMQAELEEEDTPVAIQFLGINEAGQESGNSQMVDGKVLPLLQDTPQANVWRSWNVTYRDVVIVDAGGRKVDVYNVTTHDLMEPANYDSLRALILRHARE